MNTSQFNRNIEMLVSAFHDNANFISDVATLSQHYDEIAPVSIKTVLDSFDDVASHRTEAKEIFDEVIREFKEGNHKEFLTQLRQLTQSLNRFQQSVRMINNKSFVELSKQLNKLSNKYDSFTKSYLPSDAIEMLRLAKQVHLSIESIENLLSLLKERSEMGEENKYLYLRFSCPTDLRSFSKKIDALAEIYSELCLFTEISESDHPMKIIKIESGSIFLTSSDVKRALFQPKVVE